MTTLTQTLISLVISIIIGFGVAYWFHRLREKKRNKSIPDIKELQNPSVERREVNELKEQDEARERNYNKTVNKLFNEIEEERRSAGADKQHERSIGEDDLQPRGHLQDARFEEIGDNFLESEQQLISGDGDKDTERRVGINGSETRSSNSRNKPIRRSSGWKPI